MKIAIGYPSPAEESQILTKFQYNNPLDKLVPVAMGSDISAIQEEVKSVHVDVSINRYIIEIVSQSRRHGDLVLGSSPRGSLSLFKAAQAWAFYNERNYVIPDDVKQMVIPVLSHRLLLKQEAKLKKISPEEILNSIVSKINVPVIN